MYSFKMVKMVNFKFYVYFTIIENILKVKNANDFQIRFPCERYSLLHKAKDKLQLSSWSQTQKKMTLILNWIN